jgi:hypothetical protein
VPSRCKWDIEGSWPQVLICKRAECAEGSRLFMQRASAKNAMHGVNFADVVSASSLERIFDLLLKTPDQPHRRLQCGDLRSVPRSPRMRRQVPSSHRFTCRKLSSHRTSSAHILPSCDAAVPAVPVSGRTKTRVWLCCWVQHRISIRRAALSVRYLNIRAMPAAIDT